MITAKPWIQQQERRVLVRGRATPSLQRDEPPPRAKPPTSTPKIDQLNQA